MHMRNARYVIQNEAGDYLTRMDCGADYSPKRADAREFHTPEQAMYACKGAGDRIVRDGGQKDPSKRFGWELRCEVVNPSDPIVG